MTTTQAHSDAAIETPSSCMLDLKLEVVAIPVSDVERAKRFYGRLGWRLDGDFVAGDTFRSVQFTPPGSSCSIRFGIGVTQAAPGSAHGLTLIVSSVEEARGELLDRGVQVSRVSRGAAAFSDPDGNGWLLQEIAGRLPGRVQA
jgi:catechol 2,3-dioxygenase-like lactoylglutathione lyase family enzyme